MIADNSDIKLRVLKEFSSYKWSRTLYYSEITTCPEVSAIKTCEIKIRPTTKTNPSLLKYEFMWTFSSDDSDFIEIVYSPIGNIEEGGHDITVNTPCLLFNHLQIIQILIELVEEGWANIVPGPNMNSIGDCTLVMYLTTKSDVSNPPYDTRTLHFKFDKPNVIKNEKTISVIIMEMSSTKKSYMKTGTMISLGKDIDGSSSFIE
ncbi:ribosomal protein L39e, putative [Entamoeba histolytica HM-3:IMSS]|uniref:Ribosomal protein L39e n=4 Tax=Entamoeba histolytica TaxID=5759 RepID=C4MB79_ENTH1|nr:hypothetical protein EHI_028530 [Entamoeba histolytica HM-1:IMSS]EAL49545.1 hypothetical protein EHI_028530 [Entamoeba histolytica HM-1:IMSS]EMD46084.1 ribosomal protein L39e [Entamoeba histolytica KU27]EMS16187.1 ribosomal protein L39e, putative [Entamoeba histolytica HM-3:IMSS]|eukprot:XP_654932.1 hypothetical protein EHI_028530 [Entamoeba histolytica HM-1:IMSS]